ncbi:MAG: amidohydrolase family protein [Gammaproteobacteria bacterium]
MLCFFLAEFSSNWALADGKPLLISAARVFDGFVMRKNQTVHVENGKIKRIDASEAFSDFEATRLDLGEATLLPGFIELHAHLHFRQVPADVVLRHGVTTLRDLGGPLYPPYGGDGSLRVMTSGPIITAPAGYPIPSLGELGIAISVADEAQARQAVQNLVAEGAMLIKIALEPGGEQGAPWAGGHGHGHEESQHHVQHLDDKQARLGQWALLSESIVKVIVAEAHRLNRKVSAHIGETRGAQIALNGGVDEWAHTPCAELPETLLKQAVEQKVKIVSTIDTLSKCPGLASNVKRLAALGAEFLYGAEIAHPDIPWGIDAQELLYLQHGLNIEPQRVLQMATSDAGRYLEQPLLGTLLPDAPADLIAVKGDPLIQFKLLEYPGLVISGGKIVVDHFSERE